MEIDTSQTNKGMAIRHAECVTGSADAMVYVRFLHDAKDPNRYAAELRGTIAELWPKVVEFQKQEYGAYLVVNEGDAKPPFSLPDGRTRKPMVSDGDIVRIRAAFTDRDAPSRQNSFHLAPSFQLGRDADHKHTYWLVNDCPVTEWRSVQRRLALHYGTDKTVCNPARIMRLAGTLNCKAGRPPLLYGITVPAGPRRVYKTSEVLARLPELPMPRPSANLGSDDPRVLHPETVEKMLAHWDPTLKGERGTWYGAIRLLAEHGIALTREMPDEWWLGLAVAWSDGSLRQKYVDADFPMPDTFKVGDDGHDTEQEIGSIFNEPDHTTENGGI